MLPIIKYSLPTHLPVGLVNVYLILSKPYTLIDAGHNNSDAIKILVNDLETRGIIKKIERIILTHGHMDHASLAETLQSLSGAEVWIHQNEYQKVQEGYWTSNNKLLPKFGLPDSEYHQIANVFEERAKQSCNLSSVKLLYGGELLKFQDLNLKVINSPGHSPGGISLLEENSKSLFSGDLILPDITPNPIVESDMNGNIIPTARIFLNSLKEVINYELNYVYPGHGKPFKDVKSVANRIFDNYNSRMYELNKLIDTGLQTIYSISQKMYPNVHGLELFLVISKIIGLVDLLSDTNHVSLVEKDGIVFVKKDN